MKELMIGLRDCRPMIEGVLPANVSCVFDGLTYLFVDTFLVSSVEIIRRNDRTIEADEEYECIQQEITSFSSGDMARTRWAFLHPAQDDILLGV